MYIYAYIGIEPLRVEPASRSDESDERAWKIAQALATRNDHPVSKAILERGNAPTSSLASLDEDALHDGGVATRMMSPVLKAQFEGDVHIRNFKVGWGVLPLPSLSSPFIPSPPLP